MRIFPPQVDAYEPQATIVPDTRSPSRLLWWSLLFQWRLMVYRILNSVVWVITGSFTPLVIGKIVDEGIKAHNMTAGLMWCAALLVAVVVGIACGILGHTLGVSSWLVAMFSINTLVTRKSLQMGHVLSRRTPAGEILSVAGSDSDTFGMIADVSSRFVGAIVGFCIVVVLMLRESVPMGLVVLIATPIMVIGAAPLFRPLGEARTIERGLSSELTGQATDIVAGLRILRGIGGEQTFGDNYAAKSQQVRRAGLRSAAWQGATEAFAILVAGIMLTGLTWMGLREMQAGRLSVGALVSFFGWAVYLTGPLRSIFEFAQKWTQGLVAAKKTIGVLGQDPPWQAPDRTATPQGDQPLVDLESGFVAEPGKLTIVVSALPDDSAALADRLGRYLPTDTQPVKTDVGDKLRGRKAKKAREARFAERARIAAADAARAGRDWGVELGGVDLAKFDLTELRRIIMISDTSQSLFKGTLQEAIDPHGLATREQAERALHTAAAEDVYNALPGGWQGTLDERGRGLSGGQRQRVVLARSLLADAPILVLVEPTSAVDAHTESRIAARLAEYRRGRTTVIMTASPLLLHYADNVVLLRDGRVVEQGTHANLIKTSAAYRRVVARNLDEEVSA